MESQILQTYDLIELQLTAFMQVLTTYGLSVIYAILLLIVGWWWAAKISAVVRHACERTDHIDDTITGFAASITRYAIIALVIITVLQPFGFQTTSLVAVIDAASLTTGLALQGTLSNLAAGIMLLFFRPFQVGDYVDLAGNTGTVKNLALFFTELATVDNVKIIIPNSDVGARRSPTIPAIRRGVATLPSASPTTTTWTRPRRCFARSSARMRASCSIRNPSWRSPISVTAPLT
ncbi:mechanosensitive ion channel domain-containing protein [Breoghania sp.]|uniref:mechanosensitive ion channel family protein n=1 Tax=Breoghania sp. TaxID=2065378 RepID=UPI003204C15E